MRVELIEVIQWPGPEEERVRNYRELVVGGEGTRSNSVHSTKKTNGRVTGWASRTSYRSREGRVLPGTKNVMMVRPD